MAAVNHITLDAYRGGLARAAVVFNLDEAAPETRMFPDIDGWEVEVKAGYASLVARTTEDLDEPALHERAINVAGIALDIMAVADFQPLLLKSPGNDFIIFTRGDPVTLRLHNLVSFGVSVSPPSVSITGADGTVRLLPQRMPMWSPAFRFYRLSQTSNDVFDAYRNLFLALEALLDESITKKGKGEREQPWLTRAFSEAALRVNITPAQTSGVSIPEFVDRIYKIRLNLFHAKQGKTFVPAVDTNYRTVSDAYRDLVAIWRKMAEQFFSVTPRGGAMMAGGFRLMTESLVDTHVAVSEDVAPLSKEDEHFSPSGKDVFVFDKKVCMTEERPGRILLESVQNIADHQTKTIGRVGLVFSDGTPVIASDDFGLLNIDGIERLQTGFLVRLDNKRQTRIEF